MKLAKSWRYPLMVSLIAPLTSAQVTIVETVTVRSTSIVTVNGPQGQNAGCRGTLPLCKDLSMTFWQLSMTSMTSSTSFSSSLPITSTSSPTTTFEEATPTGTPQGFLISATIPGDPANYYFSYTGASEEVVLVPQTYDNATYWFLNGGHLREVNPPYRFVWLNPDLDSSVKKKRWNWLKRDEAVIYDVGRSHDYDDATENPLDSLRQVSEGYSVLNSINTTVNLRSHGISYSFAARKRSLNKLHDVIAIRSEDIGGLPEGYALINLEADVDPEPGPIESSTTASSGSTTKTGTPTSKSATSTLSISGFAGYSTNGGVEYIQTEPIDLGTPPPVVLKPIPPYGGKVDTNSPDTLKPDGEVMMFFGAPSASGLMIIGTLNATFLHHSVNLDNSALVVSVVCTDTTMTLTWTGSDVRGKAAWQVAQDTWSPPLVLLSSSSSCPRFGNDTQSHLTVDSVQFSDSDGLKAVATGSFEAFGDLLRDFDVEIGQAPPNVLTDNYVPNIGTPNSGDTGLKFAAMGQDFNQRLNAELGFYDVSTQAGLDSLMEILYPPPSATRRLRLMRRWGWSDIFAPVTNIVKKAAATVAAVVIAVVQQFVETEGSIAFKTFFTPTGNGTASFDERTSSSCSCYVKKLGPWGCQFRMWMFLPDSVTTDYAQMSDLISKWGNQLIGQTTYATPGIELYCVDCFVNAELQIFAKLRSSGLEMADAYMSLSGNMTVQIQLGFNAYWEKVSDYGASLTKIGLGPIQLGSFLQIGPYIALDFKNEVKMAFIGQLLVGFSANWPRINGRIDFLSNDKDRNTLTGITDPVITKVFQVYGSVTITWTIGIPVSIALGAVIDAKFIKWKKDIALRAVPQIVMSATLQNSGSYSGRDLENNGLAPRWADTGLTIRQDSSEQYCNGFSVEVKAEVKFEFDFFDIATLPLGSWPNAGTPFYLLQPQCIGKMVDVPMCRKSAVAALKADATREAFCSELLGWNVIPRTTATVTATSVRNATTVVTSTTTATATVRNTLTTTSWSTTRYATWLPTSRVSGNCAGTPSVTSLASRHIASPKLPKTHLVGKLPRDVEHIPFVLAESEEYDYEDDEVFTTALATLEARALTTPTYFSGWNYASMSSACGCILIQSPGTQRFFSTTATQVTSTATSTRWITVTGPTITVNTTVPVTSFTSTLQNNAVSTTLTQQFPSAQYSIGVYTATASANWRQPFVNYNLDLFGSTLGNCTCQAGQNCTWTDPYNDYNQTQTCTGINNCNEFCAGLNYAYGASDMFCVGTTYIQSRNTCVFRRTVAGLNNATAGAGCGDEKYVSSVQVVSGLVDYTKWMEWNYKVHYTNGSSSTYSDYYKSSRYDRTWSFRNGSVVSVTWNGTVLSATDRRWLRGWELREDDEREDEDIEDIDFDAPVARFQTDL